MKRRFFKKFISLFLAFAILLTLSETYAVKAVATDPLVGRWERFGDGAEGTIVKVTNVNGVYQSVLEKVTGTLIELSFAVGDLKWKDITLSSGATYSGKDMFRYSDSSAYEYVNIRMEIDANGTLKIATLDNVIENVIIGTYQTWRKLDVINPADVPSSWAVSEIEQAKLYQLTTDKLLGNYRANITREEFCEIVLKLYESLSGTAAMPYSPNPFTDTTNPQILKAYNLGIVNGKSLNHFEPNSSATRAEISTMLLRAVKKLYPSLSIDIANAIVFADESLIPAFSFEAVKYFNSQGIINGVGNNKFAPTISMNREQAIALIKRIYEKYK